MADAIDVGAMDYDDYTVTSESGHPTVITVFFQDGVPVVIETGDGEYYRLEPTDNVTDSSNTVPDMENP